MIYSDGSSLDTKYRGLTRGAGAAVQITEEGGWRGFIIRVPYGLPKGAAVPEQLAASFALRKCADFGRDEGEATCIVTDCEAVVKVARSMALKCHHKSIFAGMWWDLPWNRASFKKVGSHQPEERVESPGQIGREDGEGNNMAEEGRGVCSPSGNCRKKQGGVRHCTGRGGERPIQII